MTDLSRPGERVQCKSCDQMNIVPDHSTVIQSNQIVDVASTQHKKSEKSGFWEVLLSDRQYYSEHDKAIAFDILIRPVLGIWLGATMLGYLGLRTDAFGWPGRLQDIMMHLRPAIPLVFGISGTIFMILQLWVIIRLFGVKGIFNFESCSYYRGRHYLIMVLPLICAGVIELLLLTYGFISK